jgi:hypothetical protein
MTRGSCWIIFWEYALFIPSSFLKNSYNQQAFLEFFNVIGFSLALIAADQILLYSRPSPFNVLITRSTLSKGEIINNAGSSTIISIGWIYSEIDLVLWKKLDKSSLKAIHAHVSEINCMEMNRFGYI